MVDIPRIQIHPTHAQLRIDGDLGQYDMKQPRPTFEIETTPATQEIRQPRGEMDINQDKAWDALGLGNNLETMLRIYSQAPNIALQGIAKIVENGNRMAAIHLKANVIADMASEVRVSFPEFNYQGDASYDNVDIFYTAQKAEINAERGQINLNAKFNMPEINYNRGKLDIYMTQYPKIEITPPQIDSLM